MHPFQKLVMSSTLTCSDGLLGEIHFSSQIRKLKRKFEIIGESGVTEIKSPRCSMGRDWVLWKISTDVQKLVVQSRLKSCVTSWQEDLQAPPTAKN